MAALPDPLPLPCGQVLPNRIMKSALSEGLGDGEHGPDDRLTRLFRRWGTGGFGLIVTGNVMIDRTQLGEPGNVAIEDERHLEELTRWAKAGKDGGTPVWVQLNHPGRQSNPIASRRRPVAPSAVALGIPGMPTPRALTEAEIHDIIDRFATAARIVETAGFDGVQIHGAHGYLVSQFLSPLANRRTDAWGGDPQRRARFVIEVARAIRAAVSPGFAVGIKLNSADFQRGGFSEEESRAVVERLAAEQLDLIEISGGSYESPAMMGRSASTRAREAYFLEYAQTVRALARTVPLAVTGGFRTRAVMAEAVESGACDVVGVGRPSAVITAAAGDLLTGRTDALRPPAISLGLPQRLSDVRTVKAFDGALDLQWHTDQLHRLGAGLDPDPARSPWRTAVSMLRRNGWDAFRPQRGPARTDRLARKFAVERAVGRYLVNPAFRALDRVGVRSSFATELETIGRKSGQPRRVPVSVLFDEAGAWIICQHGLRSGWGNNVRANPRVRLRQGDRWRIGVAELRPDDDVVERAKAFAPHPRLAPLTAAGFAALQTTPISVRVTFTDN
ncbi:nitroreductase family deazaflavin-dependent oxidoreductase [Nocardia sp. CDC159]|uniref:Nitroreductase family deazaflavin-dependent oxidoreductase n=1 Tax=Nocardia pulmonis TaxID=2951408 RepID=A0A9X2IXD4_9NOCA|nr:MULTISPECIES: nitroreductase family deazaflavin-dependent oxidoreductase [Nocardia]MCM6773725.1 nitroreductase family deazaflavin-dependent oxidoreductase [Nocardia pulmonis]MCM6786612.1 nitroreductase family deazaflavin-dependent oxidoreductase [Nocardia sp. CDC159]